jgi:UTP pyrophosphatase
MLLDLPLRNPNRGKDAGGDFHGNRQSHFLGQVGIGPVRVGPSRVPIPCEARNMRSRRGTMPASRSMTADLPLPYLQGYPPALLLQVRDLIRAGRLAQEVAQRHPDAHEVRTERALYGYVNGLKSQFMKTARPLSRVAYDPKLHILRNVLGTHSTVSRVQGSRLKAKREIRVATLFKDAPADFLRLIVVHELAHLKESDHGKAFYALCQHMEPRYHQVEFDLRLRLTVRQLDRHVQVEKTSATGHLKGH